jgi:hypothetical protein
MIIFENLIIIIITKKIKIFLHSGFEPEIYYKKMKG